MTHGEIIAKYATKEPLQKKCPVIYQRITRKDKVKVWDSSTGNFVYEFENNDCAISSIHMMIYGINDGVTRIIRCVSSSGYQYIYVNYNEEYGFIEFALITMSGNVGKSGEPRRWEFDNSVERIFVFRNDMNLYDEYGNEVYTYNIGKYYNKYFETYIKTIASKYISGGLGDKEFIKFAGTNKHKSSSWYGYIRGPWTWISWYKAHIIERKSKDQDKIDDIVARYTLSSIKDIQKKYVSVDEDHTILHSFIVYENINDEWCVLRYLKVKDTTYYYKSKIEIFDYNNNNEYYAEEYRIYIPNDSKKKTITCMWDDTNKKFVKNKFSVKNIGDYGCKFINLNEAMKFKRISWIKDIIGNYYKSDEVDKCVVKDIYYILSYPILEEVYKAGYKNIYKALICGYYVQSNFIHIFGFKYKKENSLTKSLRLNKYQIKYIDKFLEQSPYNSGYPIYDMLKSIRLIYSIDNIDSLSNDTFDKYVENIRSFTNVFDKNIKSWKWNLFYYRNMHKWTYERTEEINEDLSEEQAKVIKRIAESSTEHIRVMHDICQMWHYLDNDQKQDYNLAAIVEVDDTDHLIRIHDKLVEDTNQTNYIDDAKLNEKFAKLQEERIKKFNYTTNDDGFIIVCPENLKEICDEGVSLNHCVGGYKKDHAVGNTNILFLRHKDSPDKSFYTIEVSNDNIIMQIHGYANIWLGNNKEAIPFVIKWLKEKNLTCDKSILLCKSAGYGKCGPYLDGTEFGL